MVWTLWLLGTMAWSLAADVPRAHIRKASRVILILRTRTPNGRSDSAPGAGTGDAIRGSVDQHGECGEQGFGAYGNETREARALARRFKTEQSASAVMIAGGLNPTANLLDMTAMVTLQRQSLEDYWVPKVYGDGAKPLLDTYTHLETDIWSIARQVLSPANQKELADIIQAWRARNPEFRYTRMIPFEEFARAAGQEPVEGKVAPGSLFGLLFLDPFARLDSTRRAIEQSEYLAERSMFLFAANAELLQDHSQLMFYDFAQSPEVQNLQSDIERFSRASEVFAEGVREFPDQVAEERLAAIQQILQGLATERTNFIAQLHLEADRLRVPLQDIRTTMAAGSQMAGSVKSALGIIDRIHRAGATERRRTNQ